MVRKSRTSNSPTDVAEGTDEPAQPDFREAIYRSADGLKLSARDYGNPLSPWLPVVCLAGFTRDSRDFHELAAHLSTHRHRPRRVVAFDCRGRGRSQWAATAETYNPLTEMNDVLDGMAALNIPRAVIVGTSRGGIIGMLMGLARPATVAGLVLNDVGPVIGAQGLARIKTYVGRTPQPNDWADAAHLLRRIHAASFPAWRDVDWDYYARLTFNDDDDGMPVSSYDPKLAQTFDGLEPDQKLPTMWEEFRALRHIPILSIRGEHSDLLSAETVARMSEEHPQVDTVTVAGEGHAPLLRYGQLLARVSAFVTAVEGNGPPVDALVPRDEAGYDLDAVAETETAEAEKAD